MAVAAAGAANGQSWEAGMGVTLRGVGSALVAAAALMSAPAWAGPVGAPMPAAFPAPADVDYPGVITLEVDVRDVERGVFRVRERIPVAKPGPMTLLLPEWLPGNHSPRGDIERLAGLTIAASGASIAWRRDPINVYAFHIEVPAGASTIDVAFQYVSPTARDQGRIVAAPDMLNLQWNNTLLYPAGHWARRIRYEPSVTLPSGWTQAGALDVASVVGDVVKYRPVDLETLVDSPLFAGRHYAREDLDPGAAVPVTLHIFADRPDLLKRDATQVEAHRKLMRQSHLVFGPGHFDRYEFLLALTERISGIGLEHHRSSENATVATYFTEWDKTVSARSLLPHEVTHSWNGKWRRPADLWTPNYDVPMRDSLLWVYEGQTQYWGQVLSARSGLWSKDEALEAIASIAATYENRAGRAWRPLLDTTNEPIISERTPQPWRSWQRPEDYYSESLLIWLDADTLIRELSRGRRSLDSFARDFFSGGEPGDRTPSTYTREDVIAALNEVQAHDWAGFLRARVDEVAPKAPLDGVTRGGYRLVYVEEPGPFQKSVAKRAKTKDFSYSLGIVIGEGGKVTEVLWDSPAFAAGLSLGCEVVAVNGLAFDEDGLKRAVTEAKGTDKSIELLVKEGDRFRTVAIAYRDGLRYPKLERVEGTPDRLGQILAPRR